MNADQELVARAIEARTHAYAPYSHYAVGAALLGESGRVYTGCNVENASYSLTICAERAAVAQAVCAGERAFEAIAVVTAHRGAPGGPCRQVLAEFGLGTRVLIATPEQILAETTVGELLPRAFTPQDLP
jgi:cytidine deaminase